MLFKDFIAQEIDIDTYNSYTDWGICFCGPCKLTDEGKKEFEDILDLEVEICKDTFFGYGDCAIVEVIELPHKDEEKIYRKVKNFLASAAGYCSESNYDKWFIID